MENLRIEKKFELNERKIDLFKDWLKFQSNFTIHHPKRVITSIYFDTPNRRSLEDNVTGVSKRCKFRLRWYSTNNIISKTLQNLQAELKFKKNTFGGKRVFFFDINQIKQITKSNFKLTTKTYDQLKKKLDIPLYFFGSDPFLLCRYEREYYIDEIGIRLTIDKNISFSDKISLNLKDSNWHFLPKMIVEVKFHDYLLSNAVKGLRKLPLKAVRNSKYVLGSAVLGQTIYV